MTRKCESRDGYCWLKKTMYGAKGPETASRVGKHLDRIPHDTYVEPFLGRGNVYKAKKNYAKKEILSDISCQQVKHAKKNICKNPKGDK